MQAFLRDVRLALSCITQGVLSIDGRGGYEPAGQPHSATLNRYQSSRLDHAVLDAYGWPHDLNGDDILGRLPALNLERARAPMVVEAGEPIPPAGPRRGGVS